MKLAEKILKKIKNKLRSYKGRLFELQWATCVKGDYILKKDLDKLILAQHVNGEFNRFDFIVRLLAIEEYYGRNNYGFQLYEKMQRERGFEEGAKEKFLNLIKSVDKNGFDSASRLPVGKNDELIDGSHRLALASHMNLREIPVRVNRFSYKTFYGKSWFENNGFSQDEIEIIVDRKEKLFYERGIYFHIILWPPVQFFFDEINKIISSSYNVLDSYDIEFWNNEVFQNFVYDVYKSDDIANWKIQKKLSGFDVYDKRVKILEIEVLNPKFRKKSLNNHDLSREMEELKFQIRSAYSSKVENYFYDIVMHVGDNFTHTRKIAETINSYKTNRDFLN